MLGLPAISAPHFWPSQISLVLLVLPSESLSPPVVIMRPSLSSVTVGYQRPWAVAVTSTNDSVPGSKIEVLGRPVNGISPWTPTTARAPYTFVPPLINTLPSCIIDMPLQNISQPTGIGVILPLAKSISAAPCGYCGPEGQPARVGGQLPEPETSRIFPVWSR